MHHHAPDVRREKRPHRRGHGRNHQQRVEKRRRVVVAAAGRELARLEQKQRLDQAPGQAAPGGEGPETGSGAARPDTGPQPERAVRLGHLRPERGAARTQVSERRQVARRNGVGDIARARARRKVKVPPVEGGPEEKSVRPPHRHHRRHQHLGVPPVDVGH
ncbi:hypothetical protein CLUG_05250 [Clavispora lusitaniae ATCC 42720]|uniref:Uncharacterized protein n=1 Tax=Clavispora lusitaniae (strain ATCC 42720) TaxID=306902 RepID=C4YAM2_CLAL4|nr:uncharacterized protein CLUG_05250 [Clavispora lusitaniae ATCC 42720]EEQ41121.1 hypothetical protein CLUG_05250 [Clavispora lusitaniae ATCC 42720]